MEYEAEYTKARKEWLDESLTNVQRREAGERMDQAAKFLKAERFNNTLPIGCSKGCNGRMCRDALNCDAKGRK